MARSFTLQYKDGNNWGAVNAVFPSKIGELFDERLDEGSVVFFDRVKAHKPLTEFKVEFYKDGAPDNDIDGKNYEYFILANDNSAEFPSGSGVYRHEVYLLERTKLLEGVLCPSITFTNALPRVYGILDYNTINGNEVLVDFGRGDEPQYAGFDGLFIESLPSIITKGKVYVFPSSYSVGEKFVKWLDNQSIGVTSTLLESFVPAGKDYSVYTRIKYLNEYKYWNESISITAENDFAITYEICIGIPGDNYRYYLPFKVRVVDEKARLKPYTITDCVCRVLELAEPLRVGETPRFTFDGVTYDNSDGSVSGYVAGSQAEYYNKIIAPELTMTQSMLREQLKVIGSYIHAEPWLDENNVVHFLDLGEQTPVNMGEYISNTLKTDVNGYCTDIRSNVQNLVNSLGYAKGAIIEPGENFFRSLRCETMYVRINEQNGVALTDLPIYSIEGVSCGLTSDNPVSTPWIYAPKDITPYVFEATEYGSNLSSFGDGYPYSKEWAIYYTLGQKSLKGLFYQRPDATSTADNSPFAIANILSAVNGLSPSEVYGVLLNGVARLVFQITYKPIAPAFLSHGKQYYISGEETYTLPYNQSDNLVESQYYGENMKGVAARLGNIEQAKTYLLSSRAQIPKIGMMLDGYSIAAVNTEYMPNYIKCTLGLSKDYNRISEYVGINSVKRMYEISERQVTQRDVLIKEDIVITSDPNMQNDSGVFFLRKEAILGAFTPGRFEGYTIEHARFYGLRKNGLPIKSVILPVLGRAFGNSIHFSMRFKDNYSAGDKSEFAREDGVSGYWQNDVPYTDYFGRIYWAKLLLCFNEGFTATEQANSAYTLPEPLAKGDNETVWATHTYGTTLASCKDSASSIRLRKDNRETVGFNIEAEFKTTEDDIIIGSELAVRCNYLVSSPTGNCTNYVSTKQLNKLKKYEPDCVSVDTNYMIFNVRLRGVEDLSGIPNADYLELRLDVAKLLKEGYRSWFIANPIVSTNEIFTDEDGNTKEMEIITGGEILIGGSITEGVYENENGEVVDYRDAVEGTKLIRKLYFVTKRK